MPVSKQRRRSHAGASEPGSVAPVSRRTITTMEELRGAIADPALDFSAMVVVAGVWWYQQLLRKVGDPGHSSKPSWKDRRRAALLLCVAMDGDHGANDDLSPALAALLRPYCPAPSFAEGWERVNRMPAGAVVEAAARILRPAGKPQGKPAPPT